MAHYKKLKATRQRPAPADPRHHGALCDNCPLRNSNPVWGDGPQFPKLAIVGEAPGRDELEQELPFVGKSGSYLMDLMRGKGLERRDVLLDNAVLCFPPGGDMKAFLQRAKKEHKAYEDDKKAKAKSKGERHEPVQFMSPIDCCRPRLMFALGVPRCANCTKWDVHPGEYENGATLDRIRCTCDKPKWVRPVYGRPAAVLATGNAALESLRGADGIMSKQLYVFNNAEKAK